MAKLGYIFLLCSALVFLQTTLPLKFLPDYLAYERMYNSKFEDLGWEYSFLYACFWLSKSIGLNYDSFRVLTTILFSVLFGKRIVELKNTFVYIFAFIFIFEFVVIRYRAGFLLAMLLILSGNRRLLLYPLHVSTAFYQVLISRLHESKSFLFSVLLSIIIVLSIFLSSDYRVDFLSELNPARFLGMIVFPFMLSLTKYKHDKNGVIFFGILLICYVLNVFDDSGEVLVRVLGIYIFTELFLIRNCNRSNVYLLVANSLFFIRTVLTPILN